MINYREIPEVKEALKHYEKEENRNLLVFDKGQILRVDIEVLDPQLLSLALHDLYSDKSTLTVPGAKIKNIVFNIPTHEKRCMAQWLREQAEMLDESPNSLNELINPIGK